MHAWRVGVASHHKVTLCASAGPGALPVLSVVEPSESIHCGMLCYAVVVSWRRVKHMSSGWRSLYDRIRGPCPSAEVPAAYCPKQVLGGVEVSSTAVPLHVDICLQLLPHPP